jgi:uncharacterized membrane-anchored protein YitT (DUF2179 family)
MNPLLSKIVIETTLKKKSKQENDFSDEELSKGLEEFKNSFLRVFKDFSFIILGIFSASFGFKGFLLTNRFIDGGATGISLLISALTNIPLYILLICINIPFIVLGYKIIGKGFAFKTALAIIGLAICVGVVEFPNVTNDNLLVAVFGGAFLGAGIGLAIRGGAVIDGTEVLAIYLSKKVGATIGDIILFINILIFSIASYLLSVEIALYSMITYLAASKMLDFIIEGIEEYTGVTIISKHSEEIRQMIIQEMGRGVTIYMAKRGFHQPLEDPNLEVVYTVVTRLELNKLNTEIEKIDPQAFVIMNRVKDTKGGMIKKRPLKH